MMMTAKELKIIASKVTEDMTFDYEYVGIRVQDVAEEIGTEIEHNSKVWDNGEETDEELDGVCAIDYESTDCIRGGYLGKYAIILGSNSVESGEDAGELVMSEAIVLDCIEL